jgi:uncharacterized membrane protein
MTRAQQPALTLFAIGIIGLGAVSLVYGDFALVWQPVAPWIPGRNALAYAAGALEVALGISLLFRATVTWSIRILFPYLVVWQMLKLPSLIVAPKVEGVYLGFGELAVLFAAGLTLFARLANLPKGSPLAFLTGNNGVRFARYYFAIWIIPIGLSHLIYTDATAHLVPAWLPERNDWAYLTGVGQMASGLGVLFNILPRIAAWAEAGQISIYTLFIWLPALFASGKDLAAILGQSDKHLVLTAFFISWFIAAGAWIVAQNVPSKEAGKGA